MNKIMLSHGSGGKITNELIKDIFQKHFDFTELRKCDDGGLLKVESCDLVLSTDSYVVTPIIFPGGDIGSLSISGTINDLASMGAEPICISVGFILEEGLSFNVLESIVCSMKDTLKKEKVPIITADTKVIESKHGKEKGVFINTTGVGKVLKSIPGRFSIKSGDNIIINGHLAEHGFAVLCARLKLTDEETIISDAKPLWGLVKSVLREVNVKFMRDPTRGGVAGVLNEIVDGMDFGIILYEDRLPISDKVKGVSELLGIDPLEVACEGKMIFVVDRAQTNRAIEQLRSHPDGKNSQVIGEITDEFKGKVVIVSPYGTKRILAMPSGERLPRIC